ncbi:hypothetical protein BV20DRAFT_946509, partial [Pilatotrama ljubarskyi]
MSISAITRKLKCDRKTVQRTLRTFAETGNLHYQRPRSGRPHILSLRDVDHLEIMISQGEALNATDAQCKAAPQASAWTMRRYLLERELNGRV